MLSFYLVCISGFFTNLVIIGVWTYTGSSILFHWSARACLVFIPHHAVFLTITLYYHLKSAVVVPQVVISIWSWKMLFSFMFLWRILTEIALNLSIAFGRMAALPKLFLPIHEHGRSFHWLMPFISFLCVLSFYYTSVSLSWLEFI